MRSKRKQVVTLGQLREQLNELLIEDDSPVMVVKNGIPLGFFLPAKVWRERHESAEAKQMVEVVLTSSGQSTRDLHACIDEAAKRSKKHLKLGVLGF